MPLEERRKPLQQVWESSKTDNKENLQASKADQQSEEASKLQGSPQRFGKEGSITFFHCNKKGNKAK